MTDTSDAVKAAVETINAAVTTGQVVESLGVTINREICWANKIFKKRVDFNGDAEKNLMCGIHDFYSTEEKHNCLGCNFDDLMWQISNFLDVSVQSEYGEGNYHHFFSIYMLLLNGVWERIEEVFGLLGVPNSGNAYSTRFHHFITVRRWANFFKHPRSFTYLVHHPAYTIVDSDDHKNHTYKQRMRFLVPHAPMHEIDSEFVKQYCTLDASSNNPTKIYEKHRSSIVVVFPHIDRLTDDICTCLENFVEIITSNPFYIELLSDESTIENHLYRASSVSPE